MRASSGSQETQQFVKITLLPAAASTTSCYGQSGGCALQSGWLVQLGCCSPHVSRPLLAFVSH